MTKIHFRSYNPNQAVLFPQKVDMRILQKTIRCAWLTPAVRRADHESFKLSGMRACHRKDDAQVILLVPI